MTFLPALSLTFDASSVMLKLLKSLAAFRVDFMCFMGFGQSLRRVHGRSSIAKSP